MDKSILLKRVNDLEIQANRVAGTRSGGNQALSMPVVNSGLMTGFRTAMLSFIELIYGKEHSHYSMFKTRVRNSYFTDLESAKGILASIKYEIENDWLVSIEQLVSANIFGDFLEMADHLLNANYKDAAAVMIGSTLEEHIRLLCDRNGVSKEFTNSSGDLKPKKADVMNADLKKANVYTSIEQKNITAWLDLRNKAAHGKYSEYKKENVEYMLQGVSNFISNYK